MDPPTKVRAYLELFNRYMNEAEELHAKGDLAQSGDKYWGAVATLLNAIGEALGMEHYSHRDYQVIIGRIYRETHNPEILRLFRMAEGLHANFYHNFMDPEVFEEHRRDVIRLVQLLKQFLDQVLGQRDGAVP